MMSDPSSVDRTTFDELTGKLVLLIEEPRPWHDAKAMHRQLSAKVKYYVRYIRSESFAGEYGQRPQDTIVRLVSAKTPAKDSLDIFQRIGYELRKNGIDFEYQVGDEGIPILVSPGTPAAPPPVTVLAPTPPPQPAAPPATVEKTTEEAPETIEVAQAPEAAETGIDAELAAEIEEALDTLEAGPAEHSDAAQIDEALEVAAGEPSDAAQIAEPPEPLAPPEPAAVVPDDEQHDAVSAFASPDQPEEDFPVGLDWEVQYVDEGPSELELLIEAPNDIASRFIGVDEPPVAAAPEEPPELPPEAEQTHPPFFPEEEFGRALPEPDEVETLLRRVDSGSFVPIIETSSGKRIRLDVPGTAPAARQTGEDSRPSLGRAVGAALGAAIVGAVAWGALAMAAGQGASPLALAVALMVGMSVRLRGGGHTDSFRLVGCLGTIFGSALGALLATAALAGRTGGQGLGGIVNLLINPASLWAAFDATFDTIDLVSLAIALYIAYKISASRAPD